jgi:hypothetical protein
MTDQKEPERISLSDARLLTARSRQWMRKAAVAGRIPGAARIGYRWTFDVARLREWVKGHEVKPHTERPQFSFVDMRAADRRYREMMGWSRKPGKKPQKKKLFVRLKKGPSVYASDKSAIPPIDELNKTVHPKKR